jgi:hypothetical protein
MSEDLEEGEVRDEKTIADRKRDREEINDEERDRRDLVHVAEELKKKGKVLQKLQSRESMISYTKLHAHDFGSIEWSTVFSKLPRLPGSCRSRDVSHFLVTFVQAKLASGELDARCLSTILYGCAKLEVHVSAEFASAWMAAASKCLDKFVPQGLVLSVWALAVLNVPLDIGFVSLWKAASCRNMMDWNDLNLSLALWALSKLGVTVCSGEEFLEKWKAVALRQKKFKPMEFAKSLCAFATLKLREELPFCIEWTSKMAFEKFNAQDLTKTVWSFATLKAQTFPFLSPWLRSAIDRIGSFSARDLSESICSLANLGIRDVDHFVIPWMKKVQTIVRELSPAEISMCLWALAKMDFDARQDPHFLSTWMEAAKGCMKQFSSEDLSNILYALGAFGFKGSDFVVLIQEAVWSLRNTFTPHDAGVNLCGLSWLSCADESLQVDISLVKKCVETVASNEFVISGVDQVVHACRWFRLDVPKSVFEFAQKNRSNVAGSKLEIRVFKEISGRIDAIHGHWIENLALPVDIYVPSKKLILQIDGAHHFYPNGEYHFRDVFTTKLLERDEFRVVRLNFRDLYTSEAIRSTLVRIFPELK